MRILALCTAVLLSGAGCAHVARDSAFPPATESAPLAPGAVPENAGAAAPCPPPAPMTAGPAPVCPAEVPDQRTGAAPCPTAPPTTPPAAPPCEPNRAERSLLQRLCGRKEKCAAPEIHVNVPPPQVIIRKEEKKGVEEGGPAVRTVRSRPGSDVMLVPQVVYVPYSRFTPTGPASMVPLELTAPPPPRMAAPPCDTPREASPPPTNCAPPKTAAPSCDTPRGACGPMGCALPSAAAGAPTSAAQTVEDLTRRCGELEAKIDVLVNALNKARNPAPAPAPAPAAAPAPTPK